MLEEEWREGRILFQDARRISRRAAPYAKNARFRLSDETIDEASQERGVEYLRLWEWWLVLTDGS